MLKYNDNFKSIIDSEQRFRVKNDAEIFDWYYNYLLTLNYLKLMKGSQFG